MLGKKIAAGVAVLVIISSLAILYRRYEAKRAQVRMERRAADMVWQEFVTQFQHDLPPGSPRSEVKKYLESQKMPYEELGEIRARLGETPDEGPVCDRWTVYASFEFAHPTGVDPSPRDALTGISLKRIGHCL